MFNVNSVNCSTSASSDCHKKNTQMSDKDRHNRIKQISRYTVAKTSSNANNIESSTSINNLVDDDDSNEDVTRTKLCTPLQTRKKSI